MGIARTPDVFTDAALALGTRSRLDHLLLETLTAPGLAPRETGALRRFLDGPLQRGQAAAARLESAVGQEPA